MANTVIKPSEEDLKLSKQLINDVNSATVAATNHIKDLCSRFRDNDISTEKGISFLEVKNHMMLGYISNLTHLTSLKLRGQSLKNDDTVERLVEIRTVLEKMRPIDQKIKYQVDKLIKTATTGIGENDPLRYKPNPGNLISKLSNEEKSGDDNSDNDDVDDDDDDETKTGSKLYKPPKLASVHFDGDETLSQKAEKLQERRKKRALSSSIIRELKEQYSEAPEEIVDSTGGFRRHQSKRDKERQEYEEKYFMRKVITKREKHAMSLQNQKSGLERITNFGGIDFREDHEHTQMKRRRLSSKKKESRKKRR